MATLCARYRFRDHSGKRAQARLWLPEGTPAPDAESRANSLAGGLALVSTARIEEYTLCWLYEGPETSVAQPGSDCRRAAVLFYGNDTQLASILLPSPTELLAEGSGPYAGYRITRDSANVSGLLAVLEDMVVGFLDPTGRPLYPGFRVGGINP